MSSPPLSSDDDDGDNDGLEILAEGIASTVYRGQEGNGDHFVVKSATTRKKFSPEPHDIVKELRILKRIRGHPHSNVSPLFFEDALFLPLP
jgi:hypothetical protein